MDGDTSSLGGTSPNIGSEPTEEYDLPGGGTDSAWSKAASAAAEIQHAVEAVTQRLQHGIEEAERWAAHLEAREDPFSIAMAERLKLRRAAQADDLARLRAVIGACRDMTRIIDDLRSNAATEADRRATLEDEETQGRVAIPSGPSPREAALEAELLAAKRRLDELTRDLDAAKQVMRRVAQVDSSATDARRDAEAVQRALAERDRQIAELQDRQAALDKREADLVRREAALHRERQAILTPAAPAATAALPASNPFAAPKFPTPSATALPASNPFAAPAYAPSRSAPPPAIAAPSLAEPAQPTPLPQAVMPPPMPDGDSMDIDFTDDDALMPSAGHAVLPLDAMVTPCVDLAKQRFSGRASTRIGELLEGGPLQVSDLIDASGLSQDEVIDCLESFVALSIVKVG